MLPAAQIHPPLSRPASLTWSTHMSIPPTRPGSRNWNHSAKRTLKIGFAIGTSCAFPCARCCSMPTGWGEYTWFLLHPHNYHRGWILRIRVCALFIIAISSTNEKMWMTSQIFYPHSIRWWLNLCCIAFLVWAIISSTSTMTFSLVARRLYPSFSIATPPLVAQCTHVMSTGVFTPWKNQSTPLIFVRAVRTSYPWSSVATVRSDMSSIWILTSCNKRSVWI